MGRNKFSSPTIKVQITEEARERAIQSNSGGCLIADGIKEQYPQFTNPIVDMATIRVTDRKEGRRYTYLTPPSAQHCLLSFDQGWSNPVAEVTLKRAVKITPVKRQPTGRYSVAGVQEHRAARVAELEGKEAREELTKPERRALTRMRNPKPAPERPASGGPTDVRVVDGGSNHGAIIHGGKPLPLGPAHPNLLRGRDRIFGAKLADPGQAFNEAVEKAVAAKLAPEITTGL